MTEKYPGHYETVKYFELVNNYNCSKKHKCLKKILDETKIYDIIINVAETAAKQKIGLSPNGKATDSDSVIFKVRILVAQLF